MQIESRLTSTIPSSEHRGLRTCAAECNTYMETKTHGRPPVPVDPPPPKNHLKARDKPLCPTSSMSDDTHRTNHYKVTDRPGLNPPAHPEFSLFADRLKSFTPWPSDFHKKPNDLALAGFFYRGTGDIVTCFSCGGSLKEWEPEDIPMIEHAHWFPSCSYLLQAKGENFIRQAQLKSQETSDGTKQNEKYNVADAVACGEAPLKNVTTADTIDLILNTPAAQSVMMMGYSRDMIIRAIERCLRSGKKELPATEIMKTILDMEEEEEELENTSDTENIPTETTREDVLKTERENESLALEKENDCIKQSTTGTTYSQCTEEPSGPNTMFTSSSPVTNYASSRPIVDTFESLSLQKESTSQPLISSELHKLNDLEEENRKLKESHLCKVCLDKNSNTVFLPCGHLTTCAECASSLIKCPLCRKHIHGTVRVYLA
ncbi:baculoviral IAP repeat-containing protein 3-like [Pecten maximus]|uniref:baculoviral IAP repeat-containing protein 3-like n=1 Tax=Pecten maximus TaxID=6579 RepID=UPI001458E063|nr:baculoviral IAP repeat-containing protein 3-like [Pecten maximus]